MRFAAVARPNIDMLQRANLGPKTGAFRFSGRESRPHPPVIAFTPIPGRPKRGTSHNILKYLHYL
jgi:hypothetical protein